MGEEINRIWAEGTPIQEIFKNIVNEVYVGENQLPKLSAKQLERKPSITRALYLSASSIVDFNSRMKANDEARKQLKNALVRGEIQLVGRRRNTEGLMQYELVPPGFWVGAVFNPDRGEGVSGELRYDELRATNEPTPATTASGVSHRPEKADAQPRSAGRPSQRDKIMEAISYHAEADQNWWSNGPAKRHERYRTYIRNKFSIDTKLAQGFSEKTFQKYEDEYKTMHE